MSDSIGDALAAISGAAGELLERGGLIWDELRTKCGNGPLPFVKFDPSNPGALISLGCSGAVMKRGTYPRFILRRKHDQRNESEECQRSLFRPSKSHEAVSAYDAMVERMNRPKQSPAARQPAVDNMPVLSNQRHEGVADATSPSGEGWLEGLQEGLSKVVAARRRDGFQPIVAEKCGVCCACSELQGAAAINAEMTLGSLLREVGEIQQAAMAAKQYSAANGAVNFKAELSGHYVQRKEDVTPHRSEAEIIARLHQIVGSADEARSGGSAGGAAKLRDQATLN